MKILGLTGSIGMGKSTLAQMARRRGIPVFDADAVVHKLLGPQGRAVDPVLARFPEVGCGEGIDRVKLGRAVFGNAKKLERLESILHPLVNQERQRFLGQCRRRRQKLVLLDIPLLFEKTGWKICDRIMVVGAPPFIQAARVLGRPGMGWDRLKAIRNVQMADSKKRLLADFFIPTGLGKGFTLRAFRRAVTLTQSSQGKPQCAKSYWIRKQPAWIR
jgi:dephospho-CoA kinase